MEEIIHPAAHMSGVCKTFTSGTRSITILDAVDYRSRHGALDLFLGPSGSGKTTFLAVLAGLLKPDQGTIRLFGKDITALSRKALQTLRAKKLSFIFQNFLLIQSRNLFTNILLAAKLAGLDKPRERTDQAMAVLGIADLKNLYPEEVSHGEKQRAVIARGLVTGANLIFADEPTAALDRTQGAGVMQILKTLSSRHNCSVLVASHDPELQTYADRIFKIAEGRLTTCEKAI